MPWPPELPAPPWPPELPAPPWPPLSVCSALEVPVLCSCPCLSWGASRAPTPPPRWNCYGVGHAFREGGSYVRVLLCVSSVPASCVHIWFVSCPCFMSLLVNLCPCVYMIMCKLPCVFKSCHLSLISSGLLITSPVYLVCQPCLVLPCQH